MTEKQKDVYNEDVFCPLIKTTCRKKCLFYNPDPEELSFCFLKYSLHGFHYLLSKFDDEEMIEEEILEKKNQKLKLKITDKI